MTKCNGKVNVSRIILLAIIMCLGFFNWAVLPSSTNYINGFQTDGTVLGKPAIFIYVCCALNALALWLPKLIQKPLAILSASLLIAWQMRNWFLLSICQLGKCLDIQFPFYALCFCSLLLFIESFLSRGNKRTPKAR